MSTEVRWGEVLWCACEVEMWGKDCGGTGIQNMFSIRDPPRAFVRRRWGMY